MTIAMVLIACSGKSDDAGDECDPFEAEEVCNGVDDDCDGDIDEDVSFTVYVDADADGYGAGDPVTSCQFSDGYADSASDCDDASSQVNPGEVETCNGIDDDCDGETDSDEAIWYADADGDGYGDEGSARTGCEPVTGEIAEGGDCDDTDAAVHPGAEDPCGDGIDTDCSASDQVCLYDGAYAMAEAGAKVAADGPNFAAGEYLDVGDVNDDGYADVALSTFYASNYQGGGYVLYGPLEGGLTLDEAGDRLVASASTYGSGRSIALGDLNDDGIDDVAIGAADSTCREWVLFGPLDGDRDIVGADVTRTGQYDTEVGHGSDVGDVSGDGVDDLIVGAYEDDEGGRDAGAVFVEFGPIGAGEDGMSEVADLTLLGEARRGYAGRYVRAGGDVDGDGVEDLIVASPYASGGAPSGGGGYLVYGGITGDVDLADADAAYVGDVSSEYAGEAQAIGDIDGDGLGDVVLGSYGSSQGEGAVYVVLGPADDVDHLEDADIRMEGGRGQDYLGLGLSADDLDGDGVGELLVGARGESGYAGAAYLFWGPVAAGISPEDADATFYGEGANDQLGAATAMGDLDGDGVGEILLGAPFDATNGAAGGALFVSYPDE